MALAIHSSYEHSPSEHLSNQVVGENYNQSAQRKYASVDGYVPSISNQTSLETEEYQGELAFLRQSALESTQIIDAMPTGLIVLDGNGIIIKSNQMAESLLQITDHVTSCESLVNNELTNKSDSNSLNNHKCDYGQLIGQRWLTIINKSFQPREDDGHEVSLKNGQRVKLEISALGDKPGQLIIITDLTQTRLLQDKLGQLQRLSSLGRMVSSLAHQIRTPLSAAMLYSANLSKASLPEQSRLSFQDKLHSRLQDLEQRVNDMLLFSKSGKEQVVSPLSVNTLIKESISAMEVIVNKANGTVDVEYCDSDCSILANKNALSGAIQNLIHNAIQAYAQHKSPTDPHGVKVAIQIYCQNEHAYISVKDNGAGISSDLKNKIFQPFYTSSKQGTGLGLAVVKSVVNAHQGNVSLLSDSGEGAHFCLTLPLLDSVRGNESIQKEKQNEQS